MSSLRLLSFNTQLRSWAMEVGCSSGYTIPPVDTAEERAEMIAQAIVKSPFDYDIVCLCEVFDEDAREVLRNGMRARFPFIVTKADWDHVRTESTSSSEEFHGLLALWNLIGLPSQLTSGYRLEDSGLMLFSRWPFATLSAASLDPGMKFLLQSEGYPVGATVPAIDFVPYDDTDGNDGDAAKGILYARIQKDPWTRYHVFFSHTQADSDALEEHRGARTKQIQYVQRFIKTCVGAPPFGEEVFFMGDLNISGEQAATAVADKEWASDFMTLGNLLSDYMIDLWGREQCVGTPGLRDPGYSATVRYPPQEQRLDYMFASTSRRLAAQHAMIDYELAQVPPGHDEVSYLSDHRPLRLELAFPRPNSTPATAHVVTALPLFVDVPQLIADGQVKWYRFDKAGTYEFMISQGAADVAFEVYLDTDLSRPRQQYRKEELPDFGRKFVLASAPFLVKVFPRSRTGETVFVFRAHLHQGIAPWDAIQLPYGVTVEESFPPAQLLNLDDAQTSWMDMDTKWFRLDGPQIPVSRKLDVTIMINATRGPAPFSVGLAREKGGIWTLLEQQGPGRPRYELRTKIGNGDQLYVQVTRNDPTLQDLGFAVTASCNVSILLGGQRGAPRLMCEDETSGWGADDIECQITVDGKELRYISNDEIGDFEQDAIRDLNQWIPDLVPYFDGVEFKVIELDDISANDIGQQTLRPVNQLEGWDQFSVTSHNPDGTIRGGLRVDVDDGTYVAQVTVTTWNEQF